jgi:hypothetical protein
MGANILRDKNEAEMNHDHFVTKLQVMPVISSMTVAMPNDVVCENQHQLI